MPQFMPFDAIKSEDAYFAICDKVLSLVVAIYLLYNRTKPLFYFMIGLFKVKRIDRSIVHFISLVSGADPEISSQGGKL